MNITKFDKLLSFIVAILVAFTMLFSFSACGEQDKDSEEITENYKDKDKDDDDDKKEDDEDDEEGEQSDKDDDSSILPDVNIVLPDININSNNQTTDVANNTEAPTSGSNADNSSAVKPNNQASAKPGASNNNSSSSSSTVKPNSSNNTSPAVPGTTKPSSSGNNTSTKPETTKPSTPSTPKPNAILTDPLSSYKKAAKAIHENGSAGYTVRSWQGITRELRLTKLDFLSGTLTSLIKSFMTTEADAVDVVCAKGSSDAKNRMPSSQISSSYVKSATVTKSGSNYVVKIVLKDQINPHKTDTDGINVMSNNLLYMEDVDDTIKNDDTVSKVVKSLDKGEITYKSYTITATMTADGKFVDITHYTDADLVADITSVAGSLGGSGGLSFNSRYYNFKY